MENAINKLLDLNRNKDVLIFTMICTFIMAFLVHGYCYSNMIFSHDSLFGVDQSGGYVSSEISLGRFLQPLEVLYIKGHLGSPWILGFFSTLWLACANYFTARTFNLNSKATIIILCLLTTTNITLAYTNATYLHESSAFMLALLFATLAVYVFEKYKYGFLLTPICVLISCGFYQAYFSVSVVLMMSTIAIYIMNNCEVKFIVKKAVKGVASLFIGLVLYYLTYQATLAIFNVSASGEYNTLENVFVFNLSNIVGLVFETYFSIIRSFIFPITYYTLLALIVNFLIVLLGIVGIIKICRKISKANSLLFVLLIVLLPLGANITYFLAQGVFHNLMTFSYVYLYLFLFLVIKFSDIIKINIIAKAIAIMLIFVGFNNYIYANHIYFEKDLIYQNTMSIMTRVIVDIEDTEGYVYAETPVVFIGELNNSELAIKRPGFEHIGGEGIANTSITYYYTAIRYFEQILPYDFESINYSAEDLDMKKIEEMPVYPYKGYVQLIDDHMIVKFS